MITSAIWEGIISYINKRLILLENLKVKEMPLWRG